MKIRDFYKMNSKGQIFTKGYFWIFIVAAFTILFVILVMALRKMFGIS